MLVVKFYTAKIKLCICFYVSRWDILKAGPSKGVKIRGGGQYYLVGIICPLGWMICQNLAPQVGRQACNVWVKKSETIHSSVISHSSKSIWVIKLSFCQNDPPMGESFWQKDSLISHILFELLLITLLWIVSVFLTQTLVCSMLQIKQDRMDFAPWS